MMSNEYGYLPQWLHLLPSPYRALHLNRLNPGQIVCDLRLSCLHCLRRRRFLRHKRHRRLRSPWDRHGIRTFPVGHPILTGHLYWAQGLKAADLGLCLKD